MDFVGVVADLTTLIERKHGRMDSDEGRALRGLREIRVAATPDWTAKNRELHFLFIRNEEQGEASRQPWSHWLEKWLSLVQRTARYSKGEGIALPLSKIRATNMQRAINWILITCPLRRERPILVGGHFWAAGFDLASMRGGR
jgi:hypothetical protein